MTATLPPPEGPPTEAPLDVLYDANAEYYDAITIDRVATLTAVVDGWVEGFAAPVGMAVVDIGAGTGRLTRHLAGQLAPRPIIAIEPARGLRTALVTRLLDAGMGAQVTVLPLPLDAAAVHLPAQIGGAIAFGVLPHLAPDGRGRLLDLLARRLAAGGSALVETLRPHTAERIPPPTSAAAPWAPTASTAGCRLIRSAPRRLSGRCATAAATARARCCTR